MLPTIATGNVASATAVAGYDVANSCRFDGSSASMSITPGSNMNLDRWTWSGWIKRSGLGVVQSIFSCDNATTDTTELAFDANDKLNFLNLVSSVIKGKKITTRVFRDPSAWYHIVVVWDSGNATAGDRIKIYVNGVRETVFDTSADPDQNTDSSFGESGQATLIGVFVGEASRFFNGYMAEVVLIDGTAYAASDFGEFDEDSPTIWKPIDVSGLTFGTHGFYLDFEASDNLGNDANGGTDLTEVNLDATNQATDTPTNNFCTWNPLVNIGTHTTYSEGNLTVSSDDANYRVSPSTLAVGSGKWYVEFKAVSGHDATTNVAVGILQTDTNFSTSSENLNAYPNGYSYGSGGRVSEYDNSTIYTGSTYTDGDILGVAVDLDNSKLYFHKNGIYENSGDPTSGATGTGAVSITAGKDYYIACSTLTSEGNKIFSANFGSPAFAITSGNADANGFGNMEYAFPDTDYYCLCTKNLAEFGG